MSNDIQPFGAEKKSHMKGIDVIEPTEIGHRFFVFELMTKYNSQEEVLDK
jgi:hypothetical protein